MDGLERSGRAVAPDLLDCLTSGCGRADCQPPDAEAAKVYFVRAELSKTSLATKAVETQIGEKEGRRLVTDLPMMQTAAESHP